jgi:hypothetical protein
MIKSNPYNFIKKSVENRNKKLSEESEYYAKMILGQLSEFMKKVVDKNIEK